LPSSPPAPDRPPAPRLTVTAFVPLASGSMVGFVDVHLPSGMTLHRCSIFAKDGRAWVGPPSKQVIGRDGTVARDGNNKPRYEPCVSFTDRATQDRWSGLVVDALRATFPEALS
jgi:hypothetical protein